MGCRIVIDFRLAIDDESNSRRVFIGERAAHYTTELGKNIPLRKKIILLERCNLDSRSEPFFNKRKCKTGVGTLTSFGI